MAVPRKPIAPAGTFAGINATSVAEAVAVERLRCMSIIESPEGATHPATARRLAFYSDMSAENAVALMSGTPAEVNHNDRMSSAFLALMDASTDALTVRPDLAATQTITGDRKAARLAELKEVGKAYGIAKGYRPAEEA
jgi:hypothetical protein